MFFAASRRSQCSASVMPMPMQKPCSAPITGLSSGMPTPGIARISVSVDTMRPVRLISLMSEPAQNAFSPAPVRIATRTCAIVRDLLPDLAEPLLRRNVERIQRLRPVDGDDRNAVRTLFKQNRHRSSVSS